MDQSAPCPADFTPAARPEPQFPGRLMPHSLEAEEALLACCLLDGRDALSRCLAARLQPDSFYEPRHRLIFAVMQTLHARQDPIAEYTVAEELKTQRLLDEVGGYEALTQLTRRLPTTAQLTFFLGKVRELWVLREVIRHGTRLVEDCHAYTGDMTGVLAPHVTWFQAALARVVHGERAGLTLRERVGEVAAELAARAAGTEDRSRWVRSGIAGFDENCRPLGSDAEDHLVVFGGGSSSGKSAIMRQIAGHSLLAGQQVLAYTRETSVKGFIRQLASNWAKVDLRTLDQAPHDVAERLQAECRRIEEYVDRSLFVYQHEPGCELTTVENLVAHARAFAWQRGAPHLVVVDYLQLFGTDKKRVNNREQEVAHVSHTLQALQRELGSVMLVGAQLNESGLKEMRAAKRDEETGRLAHRLPNAGDFRESQAIYHDADRVVAIYRPPENCKGEENYGPDVMQPEQWLVQIKRRYGGEGSVRCWFEKRFLNFREFGRADSGSPAPQATKPSAGLSPEEKRRALQAKKQAREPGVFA